MHEPLHRPLSILIYRTGGIGDVVLSTVSLDIIFQLNRAVKVYWVSFQVSSELIGQSYPEVTNIVLSRANSYAQNTDAITSRVAHLDLVIDLQRSARSMILGKRIARKYGVRYSTWNKGSLRRSKEVLKARISGRQGTFRTSIMESKKPRYALMAACTLRALSPFVRQFGTEYTPKLPGAIAHDPSVTAMQGKVWIAVAAGGLHAAKWAPATLMADVLLQVGASIHPPPGFAFFGDENDLPPSRQVIEMLGNRYEIQNHCGQGSLFEAAATISHCHAMLTNDTALAHIAEAVHVDVAMLFGPTIEAFGYAPFRKTSRAFSAPLNCRPCTKDGDTICRFGDQRCFALIRSDDVAQFLIENLNERQREQA